MTAVFDGTPSGLVVEIETGPGVWFDISSIVDRAGVQIEWSIDGYMTRASFPLSDNSTTPDIKEFQRIRASDRTDATNPYPRYWLGFIRALSMGQEGADRAWSIEAVSGEWLLDNPPRIIPYFVIPPGAEPNKALAGGAYAPPAWAAGTAYVATSVVRPTVANGIWYKNIGEPEYAQWSAQKQMNSLERIVPKTRNGLYYRNNGAAGKTGRTEPVWPLAVGGTVVDGAVTWTAHAELGKSGQVEPAWPTTPLDAAGLPSRVINGGVWWEYGGSTTLPGLFPTYLPQIDATFANSLVASLPFREYFNVTPREILDDIGNYALLSQAPGYYVSVAPDNAGHTAAWGWRLQYFDYNNPAHIPFTTKELTDSGVEDATRAGYTDAVRNRQSDALVNAPKVVGAQGAAYEIDPAKATRNGTGEASTDRILSAGHGLADGTAVYIKNTGGALPGGLAADTLYYVVASTANTLKLSLTVGGAAVDITSDGTGTQQVYEYGGYPTAASSYAYYNNLRVAKLYVDEDLLTNDACRRRAEVIAENYAYGLDTVSLQAYEQLDVAVLGGPRKTKFTNAKLGYSQTPFAVTRATLTFDSAGVANYSYELGATFLEPGQARRDTLSKSFRGGLQSTINPNAPKTPVWGSGTDWILENHHDPATGLARVQVEALLGGEGNLYRTWWRYRVNNGPVRIEPKEISQGTVRAQYLWIDLPESAQLQVSVYAENLDGRASAYSVEKTLTTATAARLSFVTNGAERLGITNDGTTTRLGTTDAQDLMIEANNVRRVRVASEGDVTVRRTSSTLEAAIEADLPLAYWRLGETSGTMAADDSGNANTGTYSGAYTLNQDSLIFDGSNKSVLLSGGCVDATIAAINTGAGLKNTVEFIMLWDGTNNVIPFGFDTYALYIASNSFGFNTHSSDLYGMEWPQTRANVPVHVAAVFHNSDITQCKLYINGVLQTLTQRVGTPSTARDDATTAFRLGGHGNTTLFRFLGRLDEFALWAGELSARRINVHANAAIFEPGLRVHTDGSVVAGNEKLANAATTGFLYAPSTPGVPTGAPASVGESMALIPSQNGKLYIAVPGSAPVQVAGSAMTNPMTSVGDLIRGGAAGAAERLAIGAEGYSIQSVLGVPQWMRQSLWEHSVNEDHSAQLDGVRTEFLLANEAQPETTRVYLDGVRQRLGAGYQYQEGAFYDSYVLAAAPVAGRALLVDYVLA